MTLPAFDYVAPTTLTEAFTLLAMTKGSRPLAGGQRLLTELRTRKSVPTLLVDLGRIEQLRGVANHPDGSVELGAGTTLVEAAEHPAVMVRSALAETIAAVADPQVRNRATIGGAVRAGGRGDLAATLLALGAYVETAEKAKTQHTSAEEFLTGGGATAPGRLITAVRLRPTSEGEHSAYERVANRATFAPVCGVAIAGTVGRNGALTSVRVAVTGALATATRLAGVEVALLDGAAPDDAGALVRGLDLPFLDDMAAGADYRRHLTGVLLGKALRRLLDQ